MDAFPQAVPPAYGTLAPGGEQPKRAHLYVGNLSPRVTEYMLQEIFAVAGPVQGVKIIPDKAGTHGSNYGFVEYHEMRSAEIALQTLSGRRIFDMEIRCNWAYQNTAPKEDLSTHYHLFVGDLSPEVNDQILAKAFSAFPSLSDARVMWDMNTGKSRGYGFLAFRDRNDAEQAVSTMNGEWLGNRAIRVNWANSKNGGQGGPGPGPGAPTGPPAVPGQPAGPSLAERLAMQAQQQQQSQQQARPQPPQAPSNLRHYGGPPPPYEVVVAQTPRDVTTIYVGHLPDGTTQQDVVSLVQSFGYINDVRVQDGRNFAFVKFDTHENAARAIVGSQGASIRNQLVKVFWGKEQHQLTMDTTEDGQQPKPAPNPAQVAAKAYLEQNAVATSNAAPGSATKSSVAATSTPSVDPAAHAAAVAAWNQQYGAQYAAWVAQQAQQAQQAAGLPVTAPLLAAMPPQLMMHFEIQSTMSAQDKFNYYISQVDKELSKYPTLNKLEQQTQVPKAYAVLGVAALFSLLVFFNIAAGFLTNFLGWALPAYLSVKALDSPGHDDDVQWLTYWIVFGAFNFVESMSRVIVAWFPYYYTAKTIFILYLILPSTRGAQNLYHKVIKPLTSQHRTATTSAAPTTTTGPSHTQ